MMRRAFGQSGLVVSALGLGAGGIGDADVSEDGASDLLSAALDLGITFIDTARSYGSSEERIGRWLAAEPSRRDRIVLSTKAGYGISGAADWTSDCITRGIDEALGRLRTDVIDVMHLHSCPRDVLERVDQVIDPLERARDAGKIKVAAYSGENDALAWATTTTTTGSSRFGAIQCSVNIFDQGSLDTSIAVASSKGLGVIAKRALGNAPWRFRERPVGHYAEAYWDRMRVLSFDVDVDVDVDPSDDMHAHAWRDLAVRFAAFAPGVSTALVGTRSREHLEANIRSIVDGGPLPASLSAHLRETFRASASRQPDDARWVGLI